MNGTDLLLSVLPTTPDHHDRWRLTVEETGEILLVGEMPPDTEAIRAAAHAFREREAERIHQ
jgi:hypothetical protein